MKALIEISTRDLIAFYGDKGQVTLPTGETVLGMAPGWSNETYECLPVEDTDPPYDAATQVKTGPVVTAEADRVTRVWAITNKSEQQLIDEVNAKLDAEVDQLGKLFLDAYWQLYKAARSGDWSVFTWAGQPIQTKADLRKLLRTLT